MNWSAIGAIGEILAAVAVVVTLLYLAKQIRQNSQAVEIAALRDTTDHWNRWSEVLASSPELADIVARGNRSYRQLADDEALRYGAFVQMFFDCAESYRTLAHDHRIEKDLNVLESIVARRICENGFRDWWSDNQVDYAPGFATWINGIIEAQR